MSQGNWMSGDTAPERQGYYEARYDTGLVAVTLYSVLGWLPTRTPGNMVGWRPPPPEAEKEEAERHLQELRTAQAHMPMDD